MNKKKFWVWVEVFFALLLSVLIAYFIKRKIDDKVFLQEQNLIKAEIQESLSKSYKEMGLKGDENISSATNKLDESEIDNIKDMSAKNEILKIQEKYPNVIGIIEIPNTNIFYEIVQGEDNEFYLNHDKEGNEHPFGEVYIDYRNNRDFTDNNTIIYGHNLRQAEAIFFELLEYKNQDFYENHKFINIYSLDGFKMYEILTVFYAGVDENYRVQNFKSEEEKLNFFDSYRRRSVIETKLENPNWENRGIISLSTCLDKRTRMIIQAIEVK